MAKERKYDRCARCNCKLSSTNRTGICRPCRRTLVEKEGMMPSILRSYVEEQHNQQGERDEEINCINDLTDDGNWL